MNDEAMKVLRRREADLESGIKTMQAEIARAEEDLERCDKNMKHFREGLDSVRHAIQLLSEN